jgi:mannose-6-phosphate isomerase-like protein (cupin superfamily)
MSIVLSDMDPDDPRWTKRGAIYMPAGEGPTYWMAGDAYTMKATAATTNGSFGFIEASVPPGAGPVAHVHNVHDEAFYLLSGSLEFLDGDHQFVAGQGDFIFVPRGHRHRFRNISAHTTKMLFMFAPGGPEAAFEMGVPAVPGEQIPPPVDPTPEAIAEMIALAQRVETEMMP